MSMIPIDARSGPRSVSEGKALRMALSLVNTSRPVAADGAILAHALADPTAPQQAAARILLEEAKPIVLAGLVQEGVTDWATLAEAAERYPPGKDETAAWIREMARLCCNKSELAE